MRGLWFSKVVALLTALLLSGCSGIKKGELSDKADSDGFPIYRIGAVLEKSGQLENWGKQSEWGMLLALDELKDKGGFRIELLIEDNKSTPEQSSNAFISLVNGRNVLCVLGAVASSNTRAMKDQANKQRVPLITHASTNVALTQDTDHLFRICWNDSFQGRVCAQFAINELGAQKAVIVTDAAQDYSTGLSRNFRETYEKLGGVVIEELTYQTNDKIFTSQVEKLRAAQPDCVFASGYSAEVALLLKTAREQGFAKPFIGGDGLDDPQFFRIAGAHAGTGVYLCNHAHPNDPDPKVQAFVNSYKERHKEVPGAMAFLGYDVIYALHDSIARARSEGEVTRERLRGAIATIKDLPLVTGTITMGPDHEVKKRAVVVECLADGSMSFKSQIDPD